MNQLLVNPIVKQLRKNYSTGVNRMDMDAAIKFYKSFDGLPDEKKPSYYYIAQAHNVDFRSLKKRCLGLLPEDAQVGPHPYLTKPEENNLVEFLIHMAYNGWGLSHFDTRKIVHEFLMTKSPSDKIIPHQSWISRFLDRHKDELSKRKAQALSITRVKGMSREKLDGFYDTFLNVLKKSNGPIGNWEILMHLIYNCDEAGFCHSLQNTTIIGERGQRNVWQVSFGAGRKYTTVHFCVNAAGEYLEPFIIYKGNQVNTDDIGCVHASYSASPRGWMCSQNFRQWLEEVFLPGAKKNAPIGFEDGPFYLVLDGHSSHLTHEVQEFARANKIWMIRLPSNATHVLQPLDVSVFRAAKQIYDKNLKNFYTKNTRPMSLYEFSGIIGEMMTEMKPESAKNGFAKTGIFPFDRSAIKDHQIKIANEFDRYWNKDNVSDLGSGIAFVRFDPTKIDVQPSESVNFFINKINQSFEKAANPTNPPPRKRTKRSEAADLSIVERPSTLKTKSKTTTITPVYVERCSACLLTDSPSHYETGQQDVWMQCSLPLCGKWFHETCIDFIELDSNNYICTSHPQNIHEILDKYEKL